MSRINHKLNILDVISRVGDVIGTQENKEVASALGVEPAVCSNWKTRGAIPWVELLNFTISQSISLDWLLTGHEPTPNGPPNGYTTEGIQTLKDLAAANKDLNEYLKDENKKLKRQVKVLMVTIEKLKKSWVDGRRQGDAEDLDVSAFRKKGK